MDLEKLSPKERAIYDKNAARVDAIFAKIHTTNETMQAEEIALAIIDIHDRELSCMPWRNHFAINVLEVEKMLVEAIKWGQENPTSNATQKKKEPKPVGSSLLYPLFEGLEEGQEEHELTN